MKKSFFRTNRFILSVFFVFLCGLCFPKLYALLPMGQGKIPLDISLKNPTYKKGLISTDEGGIVRGPDFYIQAQHITYLNQQGEQILKAHGNLLFDHKGKLYRADSVTVDFQHRTIEAINGVSHWGDWFLLGEKISLTFDGEGSFTNATLTTSNNEKDDWSIRAKEVEIKRGEYIKAHPVVFHFDKLPILYLPSLSASLKKDESDMHISYRVRYSSQGLILGVQSLFYRSENWLHRAHVDYSFRYGLGFGVYSSFKSDDDITKFNCLNFVAQSKEGITHVESTRYRLLGGFTSYNEQNNIKIKGMYDKLSDKGMQRNFLDHHTKHVRAGLTKLTLSKEETDYLARLNTVVRLNTFQTIKQELPLFSINQHTFELGNSGAYVDQRFSAGYLRYVYAMNTPHATNFGSSRTELDQRLYRPLSFSVFQCTPWVGWRAVQYSSSPRNGSTLQAIGEGGLRFNTHLVGTTPSTTQLLEPYVDMKATTSALKRADRVYIFDIQDSFERVCFAKPGFQHTAFFLPNTHGFQQSLYSELYALFFFNTPHLQSSKPRIRWNETWNATEKMAWKTALEYDVRRRSWSYGSILMKYTLTKNLATHAELRAQDKWYFRKMDTMNYDVEAFHSPKRLLSTELSDPRFSWILGFTWTPTPLWEIDLKTIQGRNKRQSRYYSVYELETSFLVRGALHCGFSISKRSGKQCSYSFHVNFGQRKGHEALHFNKIGQGTYDIW